MPQPRTAALAVALGALLLAPAALAEGPPTRLWTEKTWAQPLDLDAPVSMRAFSRLAKELSPAVVNIGVRKAGPIPSLFGPGSGQAGLGTGFIIHADGYVLTNNHVIKDADAIEVRLANDHVYPASVVGSYAQLDVALLKVDAREPLTVAALGSSRSLEIGEWVIAIGNPFGLSHTVTAGIVSAKGRRDVVRSGEPIYARFIQTDASINPGNSGGPLINIRGEVVGINTAINAAGQGIGFAVPVDMVKKILPQLATGRVSRSFLGVRVDPVGRDLAARLRLPRPQGALVREVLGDTPAARAGVQPGDVILRWDGKEVAHWEDLLWLASTTGDGRDVHITVNRAGREVDLQVKLTRFPGDDPAVTEAPSAPAPPAEEGVVVIEDVGLSVAAVRPKEAALLGLEEGKGVRVSQVASGSAAEALGIRAGDVIVQVNYDAINGVDEFADAVDDVAKGEILSFTVQRAKRVLFKAFTR